MSLIFDIKRYAINDGPGIRITIFFKGCPLSCVWCHNPEGISSDKEKLYTRKKCIGCKMCVKSCPQHALTLTDDGVVTDKSRCILCGKCEEVCPTKAMEISGHEYPIDYYVEQIEKEIPFMDKSGGGVTFCGGEPLMHHEFLLQLLERCGNIGVHRAVDTTLYARPEIVMQVRNSCELFLVDLKSMDSDIHKKFTGVPNELILSNLRIIAESGADFIIRIPLIVGVNADEDNIRKSAEFLSSLPWQRRTVELLKYHDIGKNKHEKLGTQYNPQGYSFSAPDDELLRRCAGIFEAKEIRVKF